MDQLHYLLRIADNALILGQRLSAWCGHGPILEQDIAITNIALDLFGQARSLLAHAANIENQGRSEDDLAFYRHAHQFHNCLLVEQPNTDWAYTIVRQFFFDAFHQPFLEKLCLSSDQHLADIAAKSLKEVNYHLRYSSEWVIRLGDGTDTSHQKMQDAVNALWMFTGELTTPDNIDAAAALAGLGPDLSLLKTPYYDHLKAILEEATLSIPTNNWMQEGGKSGRHSEHLDYILAEMQQLPRAMPGLLW
jgi:ring-1,2-phenylacetyl-CoA epoxidase subunit PaaC